RLRLDALHHRAGGAAHGRDPDRRILLVERVGNRVDRFDAVRRIEDDIARVGGANGECEREDDPDRTDWRQGSSYCLSFFAPSIAIARSSVSPLRAITCRK